ncbi:class I SAM-dependent methyltransferase [Planctopirus hydrillae]|uniref:class I SAM-dependent methyltransferase n=1 Tax=Planctopirus hydrillae TaxID=1841610 RepID=UPI000B329407|nr:class I SAM-dependent methyltransferase [Planctopirus hydrillae]
MIDPKPTEVTLETDPRFAFGANWWRFLSRLTEPQIATAEQSIQKLFHRERLDGLTFLDVGSGSGLFSLAANRLGAIVTSIDFDPQSVACAEELRRRYGSGNGWTIQQGSARDQKMMASLGQFDIVYSWGVLHHTGDMWSAIAITAQATRPGGHFCLSIYNDQGAASDRWKTVKKLYVASPSFIRLLIVLAVVLAYECYAIPVNLFRSLMLVIRFRNPLPIWQAWFQSRFGQKERGMYYWTDMVDWVGGWPFEVAKPEEIFRFLRDRGFTLFEMRTVGGRLGCNEFVFRRDDSTD